MYVTDGEPVPPSEQPRSLTGRNTPSIAAGEFVPALGRSVEPPHLVGRPAPDSATPPVVPLLTLRMVELLLAEIRNLSVPPGLLREAALLTGDFEFRSKSDF
jgi:hypothetical protein